jgi:putative Mn2+ efflux pump MntP
MAFLYVFVIALGLSVDCLVVSIAMGLKTPIHKIRIGLKFALIFGLFHILMPLTGWFVGTSIDPFTLIDHWIAFILLLLIGSKMIYGSFKKDDEKIKTKPRTFLALAIATSIDSLAVGISLGLLKVSPLFSALSIGVVAATITFIGFEIGKRIGNLTTKSLEIIGGIVLIAVGIKILLEHLV